MRLLRLSSILIVTVIAGGVFTSDAMSQGQHTRVHGGSQSPYQDLRVDVSCQSRSVRMSDNIILVVSLRNEGTEPLFLYNRIGWGEGGGLTLRIDGMGGNTVASPVRDDTMLPPPRIGDFSILVRLDDNEFFGVRRISPVRDLVSGPGQYKLRVSYSSLLYPDLVQRELRGLRIIWDSDPPIRSEWITIDVRP